MDEMGETRGVVHRGRHVLALRVREQCGPGSPRHPELLLRARQPESL